MCRLWQVSGNFSCSVPRSVSLTGILAEKVPNISSIKGTAMQYIQYTYKTLSVLLLHNKKLVLQIITRPDISGGLL